MPVRFDPALWMRLLWSERYTVPTGRASRLSTRASGRFAPRMWRNALIPVTRPPAERDTDVRGSGRGRKWMDETYLSAERSEAGQDARIPQADVDQGRPGRDSGTSGERSPTAVGVITAGTRSPRSTVRIGPVRSRQTHEALRRSSSRGRSGPLSVAFVANSSWSGAEVAYAINRRVGIAVVRNRLRRRLKAIMAELGPSLPTGAYVVRTGPEGPSLSFEELKVAMSQAVEKATRRPLGGSSGEPGQCAGDTR